MAAPYTSQGSRFGGPSPHLADAGTRVVLVAMAVAGLCIAAIVWWVSLYVAAHPVDRAARLVPAVHGSDHHGTADDEAQRIATPEDEHAARAVVFGAELGKKLFVQLGCVGCHGVEGQGGVVNPNYIRGTVPALDLLAERLFVDDPEDAAVLVAALAKPGALVAEEVADLARVSITMAQYGAISSVIRGGSKAGKAKPDGATPFDMPPFGETVAPEDVDGLIAYLVTLYSWEDEYDDEDSD